MFDIDFNTINPLAYTVLALPSVFIDNHEKVETTHTIIDKNMVDNTESKIYERSKTIEDKFQNQENFAKKEVGDDEMNDCEEFKM